MNSINSVVIEGNMVRDPTLKTTAKGNHVCNFSIASNRSMKTATGEYAKEVSFFDVESWGAIAETCQREGSKGRGVRVVGRLKQNRWDDSDGKHYSRVIIVSEHVEFKSQYLKDDDSQEKFQETESVEEEVPAF